MLTQLCLREMVRRLHAGETDAAELWQAHCERIAAVDSRIHAVAQLLPQTTCVSGPLCGVPLTIKDNFDIAGMPTPAGSRFAPSEPALRDSQVAAKLKGAGAALIARSNVPELVSSYETDNHITGRTNNPHDLECTPGGSSGGEAALIASYASPGGVGSDGGGSIRIPAHFCGIAGFKPTHRRIGGSGQWPAFPGPPSLMATPGPMARTVTDVKLLFQLLQGLDERDSLSLPAPRLPDQHRPRIGVWRQFYKVPVHPSIREAVDTAANKLRSLGYEVEDVEIRGLERAPNVWAFFFGDCAAPHIREILAGREADAHWTITENLRDAPPPDLAAVLRQYAERERLRSLTLEQMQRYPILLMPPCSIPAFRHRERRWQIEGQSVGLFSAMALATIWNLFGFPALVQRGGWTPESLPVGVQLVGRPFEDERVLQTGIDLESD